MGQGRGGVYNLISIIFLILSAVVLILGIARLAGPGVPQVVDDSVPELLILPTLTPSFTPLPTLPPTETTTPTPTLTPTFTTTPPPTETATQVIPPSATITNTPNATPTPTVTPSPSATQTSTATQTPSGPPTEAPSPFPFALRNNQVSFTNNFANTAGCNWQGVGGAVFDLNGQPFAQLRVHVFGPNTDLYTATGTNSLYGQGSGWEIPLTNAPNNLTYYVELQSTEGTVISPTVQITFPAICEGNLAIVNFEQTRPLN